MHANDNMTPLPGNDKPDETGETHAVTRETRPGGAGARLLAKTRTVCKGIVRFVAADPAGAGALASVVLTGLLVFSVVLGLLKWLINGHPLHDIRAAVVSAHLVADPIGAWFDRHLAGLPISTATAAWSWGAIGLVVLIAAASHHLAAQLLWPVFGAATGAMAWAGTADPAHRPVVAAVVAIVWSLLTLPALRRRPPRADLPRIEQAYQNACQALEEVSRHERAAGIRHETPAYVAANSLVSELADQVPFRRR